MKTGMYTPHFNECPFSTRVSGGIDQASLFLALLDSQYITVGSVTNLELPNSTEPNSSFEFRCELTTLPFLHYKSVIIDVFISISLHHIMITKRCLSEGNPITVITVRNSHLLNANVHTPANSYHHRQYFSLVTLAAPEEYVSQHLAVAVCGFHDTPYFWYWFITPSPCSFTLV